MGKTWKHCPEMKAAAFARMRKVVELRASGQTFKEIGSQLGVTGQMARIISVQAERRLPRD